MKTHLNMRNFYRNYGKDLFIIEAILMIALASFSVDAYLALTRLRPPPFTIALTIASVFTGVFFIHELICVRIGRVEFYPHKTLRLGRYNSIFYKTLLVSSLFAFVWIVLVSIFFPELSSGSTLATGTGIMGMWAIVSIFMLYGSFSILFSPSQGRRKTRLCLRTTLVGLKLISNEPEEGKRLALAHDYMKWFKEGLRSYNAFLHDFRPLNIEVIETDDYYRSICCSSILGNWAERELVSGELRRILDSIGSSYRGEDFRQVLVGLRNIGNLQRSEDFPLHDLSKMVTVLSLSEKVKRKVESPYFVIIGFVIDVIIALIYFLK